MQVSFFFFFSSCFGIVWQSVWWVYVIISQRERLPKHWLKKEKRKEVSGRNKRNTLIQFCLICWMEGLFFFYLSASLNGFTFFFIPSFRCHTPRGANKVMCSCVNGREWVNNFLAFGQSSLRIFYVYSTVKVRARLSTYPRITNKGLIHC